MLKKEASEFPEYQCEKCIYCNLSAMAQVSHDHCPYFNKLRFMAFLPGEMVNYAINHTGRRDA